METFNESVLGNAGKILVKFGAPWCGPCKAVTPTLDQMVDEGFNVFDVNTDENQDASVKYQIRSVPTFIVFENGEEVERVMGVKTKTQLTELLT